jgi:Domain of unknown function (DUF4386)
MEPITNASARVFRPKFVSRMVGAGYLFMMASGFDLFYVLAKLYVRGDAAATAANIKAHEALFLAGFAGALIGVASSLVVTALFYRLYEPSTGPCLFARRCSALPDASSKASP